MATISPGTGSGPLDLQAKGGESKFEEETVAGLSLIRERLTANRTNDRGDPARQQVKADSVTAYNTAAGGSPFIVTDIGGQPLTLGVHNSPTTGLAGALTFDAGGSDADVPFQQSTPLTTASVSQVNLSLEEVS